MFKKYTTAAGIGVGMTYRMSDLQPEVLPRPRQAGDVVPAGTVSGFGRGVVVDHMWNVANSTWEMGVTCDDGSRYTLHEPPSPIMFFEGDSKPVGLPGFAPMDVKFPETYKKAKRSITR